MDARELQVLQTTYRDQRFSFRPCGADFIPMDAFGSPKATGRRGNSVSLHLRGLNRTIATDFPTNPNGTRRWFTRDRSWVRDFVKHHDLQPGDRVNILRLSEREYELIPVPRQITFIDLFAGIGGTRIAFQNAGGQCVFSSEWDEQAKRTYFANHGETPKGDIRQVATGDIPNHTILIAGFPCQPFSIAGVSKKNALGRAHGFADETQGTLFFEIVRILQDKQPVAFVLENVRNLRSHDQGRTFAVILRTLHALGYDVQNTIIDGANVVPQHRERIFIVGTKPALKFQFPTTEELQAVRRAATLGEILEAQVDPKYTLTDHLWRYLQNYAEKHRLAGNGFGFGLVGPENITRTLSARYYKDGSEILIRQARRNPRRLTPRECARLMGFPDDFIIPVSDTQAYKQFGNSVVVPVVEAIATKLIACIRDNRLAPPNLLP